MTVAIGDHLYDPMGLPSKAAGIMECEEDYPKEDICAVCGGHIGWVMGSAGQVFRLGLCDVHRTRKGR